MSRANSRNAFTDFSSPQPLLPAELYREKHWYVCRTRARAEKKVDALLAQSGLETYLAIVTRERQWADRVKRVGFPLFPGYTFARFDLTLYHDVLTTPGVVTVVRNNGRPARVSVEELESVRRFAGGVEETGIEPQPVDFLEPGDPVRVVSGPFAEMHGLLLHRRSRATVAVRLTSIKQALAIVLDRELVRRVSR